MKSLFKNSLYNIVYRMINVLYPLITTAYVSRVILVDGVGRIASAQNVVQYFTILAALGIPVYGIKVIAQAKGEKNRTNVIFSELFFLNALSTTICLLAYYLLAFFTNGFGKGILLYSIVGVSIIINYFNVDWFYQGREEYSYILVRNIFVKIISLVLILKFVKTSDDYIIYAIILVLGVGLNNIFNIIHLRKYVKLIFRGLNLKKHLAPVCALFSATIAIQIYTLSDTTMLTYMCGENIVGYYSNAVKSISAIKTMMVSMCAVFLPRLSLYIIKGEKNKFNKLVTIGLKIIIFLTIPSTIGIILIAKLLVPFLFGLEFNPSAITTQILSISIITVSLSNFIGYQVLVSLGREKTILFSTTIGAITNVLLNAILIMKFQQNGAAIASVITESIVAIIQVIDMFKCVKINIGKHYIISVLLASLSMGVSVYCMNILFKGIWSIGIRIFANIFVGVIVYIIVSYIMKNEILDIIVDKIKKLRIKEGI